MQKKAGTVINILLSVLTVKAWGLIGVAIGTLVAMAYQTVWLAVYDSKCFVFWPLKSVAKQFLVDGATAFCIVVVSGRLTMHSVSYISWVVLSIVTALLAALITVAFNIIFYKNRMTSLFRIVMRLKEN